VGLGDLAAKREHLRPPGEHYGTRRVGRKLADDRHQLGEQRRGQRVDGRVVDRDQRDPVRSSLERNQAGVFGHLSSRLFALDPAVPAGDDLVAAGGGSVRRDLAA